MAHLANHGWMPVDKNMPAVAGALRWACRLRQRVAVPVRSFKMLQHPSVFQWKWEHCTVLKDSEQKFEGVRLLSPIIQL
jgi:hypothetical protein